MEKRIQAWFRMCDEEYEERLCDFLQYHYAHLMEVHRFDEAENGAWIAGDAVLLTDMPLDEEPYRFAMVLVLKEEKDNGATGTQNSIELYQSGHQIAKRILEAVEKGQSLDAKDDWSAPLDTVKKGRIWAVYSPTGGVGKTTFAITLAMTIAQAQAQAQNAQLQNAQAQAQKPRVLYLDLENIPSFMQYFDRAEFNLSDLLYWQLMDCEKATWAEELEKIAELQPCDIYTIAPPQSYEDVLALLPEDIDLLMEGLKESFDYIICDFDTSFWGATERFLQKADKIFVLWKGYLISDERRIQFERLLEANPELNDMLRFKMVKVGRGNAECYTDYLLPEQPEGVYVSATNNRFHPVYKKETPYAKAVQKIVDVEHDT